MIVPVGTILILWASLMFYLNAWPLYQSEWIMALTMVFGSFIAGASSEGGGAIAYPVMTLLLKITPEVARNFSLAIQSVGMSMAAYLIIIKGIKVEYKFLAFVSMGGVIGIILGTLFLVPYIAPAYAKMLFVSFWLSFGVVLFFINEIYKRKTIDQLPKFSHFENLTLLVVGLIGGTMSAIMGSGIDIFSFSYVTMRYHLSEKIATPTSVIIMAINSIVGFVIHMLILKDFGVTEFNYWLVCIPIVVIGAPLGARFINQQTRGFVAKFLYIIIIVQFIGALFIVKPTNDLLIFSVAIFLFGMLTFFGFSWLSKKVKFLK